MSEKASVNIADQTEQQMIESILRIYSGDDLACLRISQHIATKLTHRRTIIRQRRRVEQETKP